MKNFEEFINENNKFPHFIKSETYWRQILNMVNDKSTREYATKVLDTVMKAQHGFASERQMAILDRARRGDNSPYPTKN